MTPEQIADLPRLLERSTKGRRVQFHPDYCPEAKDAPFSDWDISHDTSVIRPDGSRYKGYAHHKHASDAELDGLAHELARHVLTQQAQIDALAEDAARAHDLALEVERLRGALKDVIGMLDDPTGHEHVRDMRGATVIARAALDTHAATAAVLSARDSIPEGE